MPNPVEGLLEVYEDMVEVSLVLEIFLTEASWVEDLLCGAPSFSEACLFFSDDISAHGFNLFSMIFIMTLLGWLMRLIVRYFWHCCRLPFLESVMTKDWIQRAGHSPVCQEIIFRVCLFVLQETLVSSYGIGRDVFSLMLSIQHFLC